MIRTFRVSNGYEISNEDISVDADVAYNLLKGKLQKRFVSASVNDNMVTLQKKTWECPFCARKNNIENSYVLSAEEISNSLFSQLRFLENKIKPIITYKPNNLEIKECAYCGKPSPMATESRVVTLCYDNNSIKISVSVEDIKQLFDSGIVNGDITDLVTKLPLNETLTFDFNNGVVKASIENLNNEIIVSSDIDNDYNSTIKDYIENYEAIRNTIHEMLCIVWNPYKFPFNASDININLLMTLVNFVGYPDRTFYEAIPIMRDENKLFPSFDGIAHKFHYYDDIAKLYDNSLLPPFKSIRKLMFSAPQLFFFLNEIEQLWLLFGDGNHLLSILKSDKCYEVLAYLHMYPSSFEYLNDYVKEKSKSSIVRRLLCNPAHEISYAIGYSGTRAEAKELERKHWHGKGCRGINVIDCNYVSSLPFVLPIKSLNNEYEDSIDGYDFVPIRNITEMKKAGRELNNCLIDYNYRSNPVLTVRKNGKALAAIEIKDNELIQAYAKDNKIISGITDLYTVVIKYLETKKIEYDFCQI